MELPEARILCIAWFHAKHKMRIWRKFIQMKLPNKDGCIVGIYLLEASSKILYCSVLFYAKSREF
jgi:hypothetical protein